MGWALSRGEPLLLFFLCVLPIDIDTFSKVLFANI